MKKPELFQQIETPQAFSTRKQAAETMRGLQEGLVSLEHLELIKLARIKELLEHPELQSLIDENKITLGIIKPQANVGKSLPDEDEEAAQALLNEIGYDNIVFTFSTKLTGDQAESFYSAEKEKYSQIVNEQGQTIWDSLYTFSQSGPLTFLLIYRENNAVEWWRNRMGKTRPNEATPDSIRGKHALQEKLPNNLVHGSDSPQSVKREVGELRNIVVGILRTSASI